MIDKKFEHKEPIVLVKYQDAGIKEGQHNPKEHPITFVAEVVGFVIKETVSQIVLTQEIFDDGDCRRSIAIPKVAILNKKVLRK